MDIHISFLLSIHPKVQQDDTRGFRQKRLVCAVQARQKRAGDDCALDEAAAQGEDVGQQVDTLSGGGQKHLEEQKGERLLVHGAHRHRHCPGGR